MFVRVSATALAAVCFSMLSACAGSEGDPSPSTSEPEPEPVEEVPYGPDNQWFHANESDLPEAFGTANVTTGRVGDIMQNYTFFDQNGDDVELYQFYGQPVILEVMAEWCPPCRIAQPKHQETYERLKDEGFVILAAMVQDRNFGPTSLAALQRWGNEFGVTHPLLAPNEPMETEAVPTSYFLDPTMRIVKIASGFSEGDYRLLDAWVHGHPDNEEICNDGIDNDADYLPDCADTSCDDEPACAPQTLEGHLEPCLPGVTAGVVDTFLIENEAYGSITIDTLSASTSFHPLLIHYHEIGNYTGSTYSIYGDSGACTFTPADGGGCPVNVALPPGRHEVVIYPLGEDGEGCADQNDGAYSITAEVGDGFLLAGADDLSLLDITFEEEE